MMADSREPNPRPTPAQPKNRGARPPAQHMPNPLPNPRPTGGAQPLPPKGGIYSVPPSGVRHTPVLVRSEIEDLAQRVRRLTVSHRDPERFHIDKSEIAHELHCLARSLDPHTQKG